MGTDPDLADDVAVASAAYLFNVLPEILKRPEGEQFEAIVVCFRTCLLAYRDGLRGWVPEPSQN